MAFIVKIFVLLVAVRFPFWSHFFFFDAVPHFCVFLYQDFDSISMLLFGIPLSPKMIFFPFSQFRDFVCFVPTMGRKFRNVISHHVRSPFSQDAPSSAKTANAEPSFSHISDQNNFLGEQPSATRSSRQSVTCYQKYQQ